VRRVALLFVSFATALAFTVPVAAAENDTIPERAEDLKLAQPLTSDGSGAIDDALVGAEGPVQVSVRMSEPSTSRGGNAGAINAQQAQVTSLIESLGGTIHGGVQTVLNAVFATVDASAVADIGALDSVTTIREVRNYEVVLDETVPYIGGDTVHNAGFDGTGITVAVLDSGIDYYHEALGGSGDPSDYDNDDPTDREGTFPTAKVIDGWDFVGDTWPSGPLAPDPDPLDSGPTAGHGTHVADIIAGELGVAPGASLVAVKVCSSVSPACSGIALIQGMEFAVGAGVDIINMSLGALYGQAFDDDLSAAVDGATAAGVLTVASAGNSSNKPYVTGSPAAAPTALSVAQTQVPSAVQPFLTVVAPDETATDIEAVFQPWSVQPTEVLQGQLQYGDGQGGNLLGCDPFPEGSLDGLIVLVDRGACNFTLKAKNIGVAGGIAAIIGLVAPGDPFQGGDGGDRPIDIPAYMISQADSNQLKAGIAGGGLTMVIDPAQGVPLIGSVVGSSSRGPSMQFNNLIKPEIGAPGASVSAIAGSGTDTGPFGGTSGAAPMVSGSAALLLNAESGLTPAEVKARLVNTADTDINTAPGAGLAPITRIGGGEVRVDRAVGSAAAAWDADTASPALSFGFVDVTGTTTKTKTVTVENYGSESITYDIGATFRFANDETGAVSVSANPSSVTVGAGGSASFDVELTINGSLLDAWTGNSGGSGASPGWLDDLEYDGYVMLDADGEANDIHLPWHVLPRKAADVSVDRDTNRSGMNVTFTNDGVSGTTLEVYDLIATSDDLPEGARGEQNPTPDIRAAGVAFYDVPAGFCASELLVAFAVNTWERQTHANAPAAFEFDIDIDNDGIADYAVFNLDLSLLFSGALTLGDGRNAVYAQNLETGATSVFFFTDHETNSANTVLLVCGEQIGLDSQSVKKKQAGVGLAIDIYFQGVVTDFVDFPLGAGAPQSPLRIGDQPVQFIPLASGDSVDTRLNAISAKKLGALVLVRGGAPEGEEAIIIEK
jgi:subtilisin family serine protease